MFGAKNSFRDPRIDLLRGFALVTIFIDHVPDNPLNPLTMRNFGFADAAELFVVLAGVSCMLAYGRAFARDGALLGLRRVLLRCGRIYLFQVGMLLATLAFAHLWREHFGLEAGDYAPFFEQPLAAIGHALALHALPASLNILPLYVILMGLFPLIYLGVRHAPAATLLLSGGVWLGANFDHEFNLRNWLDGQGWFFNPFAWQFLFTLGAFGAVVLRENAGEMPRLPWLRAASWAYLAVSLLLAAPWTAWGLPDDLRFASFDPPDKTSLAPARLLDIMAIMYLALGSPALRRLAGRAWAAPLALCGRHSLEVFALATMVALVFRLLFHTYGAVWLLQALVNPVGIAAMVGLAMVLENRVLVRAPMLEKPVESGGVT